MPAEPGLPLSRVFSQVRRRSLQWPPGWYLWYPQHQGGRSNMFWYVVELCITLQTVDIFWCNYFIYVICDVSQCRLVRFISTSSQVFYFKENGKRWLLSQHQFGWPEHRPRLYTVMTKRSTCKLDTPGLQSIFELMRAPALPVSALYCAPQDGNIYI